MSIIRILHICPSVGKASFGIGPVVLNTAINQLEMDAGVNVWSLDADDEIASLERAYALTPGTVRSFPSLGPKRLAYSPKMERSIIAQRSEFDVVHQHGIWTATSRATRKWKMRTDRPTVIAPHGSLSSWALGRSRWKKRVALAFYEKDNLQRASCLHALSDGEANDFRNYGLRNPLAVIPNGVSESWLACRGNGSSFRSRYGIADSAHVMLYLGRITPIKGLPLLLRAISLANEFARDWILIVAGENEFDHRKDLELIIAKYKLEPYVKFVGPQYGQNKVDAFAAANVFVLPSYSEAGPIAILEALGAGLPILTTRATPWEGQLASHRCGWWIDISEQTMIDALQYLNQQSLTTLREMGQRGREAVSKNFTWKQSGQKAMSLYRWLLQGGSAPNFVMMG